MKNVVTELIENEQIAEPKVIDLISTIMNLIELGVMDEEELDSICERLGIKRLEKNVFEFNEDNIYTLN